MIPLLKPMYFNHNYLKLSILFLLFSTLIAACDTTGDTNEFTGAADEIRIMTLNPGHFHAALVQKNMLNQVDPVVHIYAPEGPDLELHLGRIESFNTRDESPTNWEINIHTSPDYMQRMLEERPGNVVVTAGNNRLKTDYIKQAVDAGLNVLSDKPMAIDQDGWELLVSAFESADENNVLLYDIMTERNEVTSVIQRLLAVDQNLFGELSTGSVDEPAIVMTSVHHLFKTVAGQTLRRPPWYFDVQQQGEGIVDVTTHLVDLSMWTPFPDYAFDHNSEVEMLNASRWPTVVTRQQFQDITGLSQFPDYLQDQLIDGELHLFSNGDMDFTLKGHHAHVAVQWDYQAPEGSDDSHFSMLRGTRSNLVIRQGEEQNFRSTLYIEPTGSKSELEEAFQNAFANLENQYPGLSYVEHDNGWELEIPDEFYLGHEAHFGKVAEAYFRYLVDGALPHWEVPNMITKYFITTQARQIALDAE